MLDDIVNMFLKLVLYSLLSLGALFLLFSVGISYLSNRQEYRKKRIVRQFDSGKYKEVFRESISMISLPPLPKREKPGAPADYSWEKAADYWSVETEELLSYATRSATYLAVDPTTLASFVTLVKHGEARVWQWYDQGFTETAATEWRRLNQDFTKSKAAIQNN